jgi:hypothetical protein
MPSSVSELATKILESVILDAPMVLQRKLCHYTVPAEALGADEQERWELLDAVRERLLVITVGRHRRTAEDAIGFSVCVQMLRNLVSSRN